MVKINSKILLIAVIGLAVIASGCTGGQDVTSVVKALPEVQQFMKEHPNAQITVTYWSKEEVAQSSQEISQQCDKPITPAAMYKASVSEGVLKIVSWINAENQIVICSTTTGSGIPSKTTPTSTATTTPESTATVPLTPTTIPTTTKESAAAISENLVVEAVDGVVNSANLLVGLNITIRVAPRSPDTDLSRLILRVKEYYMYSGYYAGTGNSNTFRVYTLKDPDNGMGAPINSYTGISSPILKAGALARLDIDVSSLNIKAKDSLTISLTPERGVTLNLPLTLPAFGNEGIVSIYP